MTSPLITAEELRDRLDAVTVLDVRYRMGGPSGPEEHAAGHVPGAVYVDLDSALALAPSDPVDSRGRHPLPTPEVFIGAMQAAGVGLSSSIVTYDDWQGRAAARAWWLLRHYGHDDVRVLDGGWDAWVASGGEVETGPVAVPHGDFHGSPGAMPMVAVGALAEVEVLIDARAPERFRGEIEPVDPVAGHIPRAVNVDTSRNLDNHGHFRDATELAALYRGVGAAEEASVAAYCGSGVTATHDILAMEIAGMSAALFAPSWSGWIAGMSGQPTLT